MSELELEKRAEIFKALGHASRLRMVLALGEGEKCVCELQALVGSDMSTVSKHLTVLRAAGLVESFKRGNFVYYRLLRRCVLRFMACLDDAQAPDEEDGVASAAACRCGSGRASD